MNDYEVEREEGGGMVRVQPIVTETTGYRSNSSIPEGIFVCLIGERVCNMRRGAFRIIISSGKNQLTFQSTTSSTREKIVRISGRILIDIFFDWTFYSER